MHSRLATLVDLLHSQDVACLATQSATLAGYPFASAVPFATDEHHRPLLLLSQLAEHTRNLAASPKASLLLSRALGEGEMARVSLVGEVLPVAADPRLVARYLRFQPQAERFLQLGDFGFYRFAPQRVLVVGGFARASWLDGQRLLDAPHLPLDIEAQLLAAAAASLPPGSRLLGLDAYGADLATDTGRQRLVFAAAPLAADVILTALAQQLPS